MLVIEDAFMHKIENIQQKFKDCDTKLSLISGGLTRYLQPLDVSIKNSFKDELIKNILNGVRRKQCKSISRRFNKLGCRSLVCWQIISRNDQKII